MTDRPSIPKSAALLTLSVVACIGLANIPGGFSHPTSLTPNGIVDWWSSVGTDTAAMGIARIVSMVLAVRMTAMGATALAAGLAHVTGRFSVVERVWASVSGDGLKRLLVVGAVVTLSAGPVSAATPSNTPPPIVLVDLGPAVGPLPVHPSTDTDAPDEGSIENPATVVEPSIGSTWVVKPGDHLWHIAEQTLESEGGEPPDLRRVTRYWKRLIELNFAESGANPDLIVPGQVINLPPR